MFSEAQKVAEGGMRPWRVVQRPAHRVWAWAGASASCGGLVGGGGEGMRAVDDDEKDRDLDRLVTHMLQPLVRQLRRRPANQHATGRKLHQLSNDTHRRHLHKMVHSASSRCKWQARGACRWCVRAGLAHFAGFGDCNRNVLADQEQNNCRAVVQQRLAAGRYGASSGPRMQRGNEAAATTATATGVRRDATATQTRRRVEAAAPAGSVPGNDKVQAIWRAQVLQRGDDGDGVCGRKHGAQQPRKRRAGLSWVARWLASVWRVLSVYTPCRL